MFRDVHSNHAKGFDIETVFNLIVEIVLDVRNHEPEEPEIKLEDNETNEGNHK